tara:strand:- start:4 stop:1944 length:1941 start_codon:yes stop_codon:yes gene_type:complete
MAFQVSPGVLVQERDLTSIIPAVSTSIGAVAGQFTKGPLDEIVSISSEQELVETFGKPDVNNFEYFFSAANFLQYSNTLRVVRANQTSQVNASTSGTGVLIKNTDDWTNNYASGGAAGNATFVAREAGAYGNTLLVATCPNAAAFESTTTTAQQVNQSDLAVGDTTVTMDSDATAYLNVGDVVSFSTTAAGTDFDDGEQYRLTAVAATSITLVQHPRGSGGLKRVVADDSRLRRRWRYYDAVDGAPGTSTWTSDRSGANDEIHIVVVDEDGSVAGVPGQILETYNKVSKASDAKTPQGDDNYYANVIYTKSQYIWWTKHHASGSNWGNAASGTTFTAVNVPTSESFSGGSDGSAVTTGQLKTAYDKFADSETVDVGLIISGKCDATHVENLITIAEARKDCVVFASPERSDVVNVTNTNTQKDNVIDFYSTISSSSYVVFDSGYKYMYDRYNDVYRYVPLNGDMAGLAARTDLIADSWFSPAGFNRGVVRGAVKLAFNPTKTQRDELYPKRINPVATFPGQGTVLFGDKTGLASPSAFDRINVRRLFITLEKAIATASKFQLFEFNDEFTRANFRNIVEPFLREVQGRRGITDFLVVCDETNNTGQVIDRNEFIAEIFIKPARSINFITLSFVATRTGVSFDEVAG